MTQAVTFDFPTFIGITPEFTNCTEAQGQSWFNRASLICFNDTSNPAFGDGNLSTLLYLLTAHIGWLNSPRDPSGQPTAAGSPAPSVVGRPESVTQGSVSASLDMGDATAGSPSQPWFMQTRWGAEYWAATAQYRTAFAVPAPRHNFNPIYTGGRGWW